MISKFTTEIPRKLETLASISLDFAVQTVDDKLSRLKNSTGKIIAVFSPTSPRSTEEGKVEIKAGAPPQEIILLITGASIQTEQGAPEPGSPYKILGSIAVRGVDQDGRAWEGRSTGPVGETSLGFEMATSDKPNAHAQAAELKKWAA